MPRNAKEKSTISYQGMGYRNEVNILYAYIIKKSAATTANDFVQ